MNFKLIEKDKYAVDYSLDVCIDSPYGEIICNVGYDPCELKALPDDAESRCKLIIDAISNNLSSMKDKVYESYLSYSKNEDWMDMMDVPIGLKEDELGPYLGQFVNRIELFQAPCEDRFSIYTGAEWDTEHSVYLTIKNQIWAFTDC